MPCGPTSPTYIAPDGITYSPVNIPAGTYSASQPIGKGYKRVITIPDGIYSFSDLNAFMQFTFIFYGDYYFSSSTSTNTYFLTLEVNASRYSAQINTFQVSTPPSGSVLTLTGKNLGTGWVQPTLPTNMVIQFSNPGLGSLFGYPLGTWTSDTNYNGTLTTPVFNPAFSPNGYVNINLTTQTISYLSTSSPAINPDPVVYVACNGINNPYALPSSTIYALAPSVPAGSIFVETPPNYAWNKLIDGTYNQLAFQLLGSDLQPLTILDPQICLMFVIADENEVGRK